MPLKTSPMIRTLLAAGPAGRALIPKSSTVAPAGPEHVEWDCARYFHIGQGLSLEWKEF